MKRPALHPLYAFAEPLTPALAARRAQRDLDLAQVRPWVDSVETLDGCPPAAVVVETAGGVFSPIAEQATNFELAQAMEPAVWVLVAADRLGVLHELGGCLRAMRSLGRMPDWIVLSAPEHADASTGTNAGEVERLGFGVPVLELPRNDRAGVSRIAFGRERS